MIGQTFNQVIPYICEGTSASGFQGNMRNLLHTNLACKNLPSNENDSINDKNQTAAECDQHYVLDASCSICKSPGDSEVEAAVTDCSSYLNVYPATLSTFVNRAGPIASLKSLDWANVHRRRHVESFLASMSEWRNFEHRQRSKRLSDSDHDKLRQCIIALCKEHPKNLSEAYSALKSCLKCIPSKSKIISVYRLLISEGKITPNANIEVAIRKKFIRNGSGVTVITVLTTPGKFSCSNDCHYCPNEPGQPRSYLSTEPAVLRANQNNWSAIEQFVDRANTLYTNGHVIDKIELLILGGTWSGYPKDYQEEFIRDLFYAANIYSYGDLKIREKFSLAEEQRINETAECRIIGLTVETRPDFITRNEIRLLRHYGCTRVQIGIQHTDDDVLNYINRGCNTATAIRAIRILKDNGFKVDIHIMPDLPSSSIQKDFAMMELLLSSRDLQADQWKIYPCEVTPFSKIEQWYKDKLYVPYTEVDSSLLLDLLLRLKRSMHPWIRLNRVVRDIPNQSIIAGNSDTNLRQILKLEMEKRGLTCNCIRCREIRDKDVSKLNMELKIREYDTNGGQEFFISFETPAEEYIFGFLRLRLPEDASYVINDGNHKRSKKNFLSFPRTLSGASLLRELHVYGCVVAHNEKVCGSDNRRQHTGIGQNLIYAAEVISILKGYKKIVVISGIGSREYYRKFGYRLSETYMYKELGTIDKLDIYGGSIFLTLSDILKIRKVKLSAAGVIFREELPAVVDRKFDELQTTVRMSLKSTERSHKEYEEYGNKKTNMSVEVEPEEMVSEFFSSTKSLQTSSVRSVGGGIQHHIFVCIKDYIVALFAYPVSSSIFVLSSMIFSSLIGFILIKKCKTR